VAKNILLSPYFLRLANDRYFGILPVFSCFMYLFLKRLKMCLGTNVLVIEANDRGSLMETASADIEKASFSRVQMMEAVMAEHETALLRYAARIVNNPLTAEDVVQNVFIKLFKVWKKGMKPSKKLKGWLYRVTHNEAVDFVRRESRLKVLHTKQADQQAVECSDGIHCPAPVEDKVEQVLALLSKLHPREQQVVVLRLQEGMSYREISEVTGRTEGRVGSILHGAVKKLAGELRRREQQAG
jgi:RNA polymerase sigma factor (sigma-70 family)